MKKIVITTGLISGAIVSTLMGISMAFYSKNANMDHSMAMGYAMMLLAFSLIFVAIKIYRDKENGGVISFGKAFTIGLLISLIASAIYVASWAVEYNYFFPDFMDKYSAHIVNKMKASGASQIAIDKQVADMAIMAKEYKNPFFFTLFTFAEIFPVGLIVSLIAALILKRKNTMQPAVG
ncbi:MAG: hypothetical protein K0Q79_3469 [Flavipsychrobacter sp.]|jgi:hypothetical protein|nr:hypothetical protein [Flavipsychrobacter sp.]